MEKTNYKSQTLEHLGLVAGMFDELGIGELVDKLIPQDLEQRKISVGQAIKAMVLNGLGFANRRLYLTSQFYKNKPTERLLGKGIKAKHLNDDALGKALDKLYDFGVSELYSHIGSQAAKRLGIKPKQGHMDTTSFHVKGNCNYHNPPKQEDKLIHVTKGHSKDHRPELNQVMLELIVENQASLPLVMKPLSGNSSDKAIFEKSIKEHIRQLNLEHDMKLIVTDNAGYTKNCIEAYREQGTKWVMTVPKTIKLAKELLEEVEIKQLKPLKTGYMYRTLNANYADVPQRWLLIYSEQARIRAQKTVCRKILKQSEDEYKRFNKLCRKSFNCQEDALRAVDSLKKTLKLVNISEIVVNRRIHYANSGRPAKDAIPESTSYYLSAVVAINIAQYEQLLVKHSCFILATTELNTEELSDLDLLEAYKGQAKVERGFRFLKDPMFLASTLYLKKVERIMALLMIMTVCLLVYTALEYRIRQTLKEHRHSLPDQKGKPTQNPTAKWVFEMFLDVHLLTINSTVILILILNLNPDLLKLLELLGPNYLRLYSGNS